jgi:CheY-like chemotaxis protein
MLTVLLVEDDDDFRRSLKDSLMEEGLEVVDVPNGLQALIELEQGLQPSIIVADLMMPGLDGWGLYDALRQVPSWSAIPFLVVTASGLKTGALGSARILEKPVDLHVLLDAVEQAAGC